MIIRPRRLRITQAIRDMTSETRLAPSMLIYPVFVREGKFPQCPDRNVTAPTSYP